MLLHRYFGSHAFETLKEAKLKTSRLSSFNDPFEFLYVSSGKTTPEKARKYILSQLNSPLFLEQARRQIPGFDKKTAMQHLPVMIASLVSKSEELNEQDLDDREESTDKFMRVICFSAANVKPLDEILMWSHYALKHYGLRVGFEFPEGIKDPFMIIQMDYREKRVEADFSFGSEIESMKKALAESAKVKSLAWRYENEYRLITLPELCEARKMPNSTTEHFLDFKRERVKTVDFGVRCPQAEIESVSNLFKTDYPHVVCRKAEFHKTEYALEYRKV
jgi:hypothetical protein